jgi:hypothetical protein
VQPSPGLEGLIGVLHHVHEHALQLIRARADWRKAGLHVELERHVAAVLLAGHGASAAAHQLA